MQTNATAIFLLTSLVVASYFDLKSRRIPNWLSYGATVVLLLLCGFRGESQLPGLTEAVAGYAACFGAMFIGYIFCGVGAGDVKLAGAIGAGLGVRLGLDAIVWAHAMGAVFCCGYVVYSAGPYVVLSHVAGALIPRCRTKQLDRELVQYPIPMAVFFALGCSVTLLGTI